MLQTDKDGILAIAASMLVLFSAMINPLLTVVLTAVMIIVLGIHRLAGRPQSKR